MLYAARQVNTRAASKPSVARAHPQIILTNFRATAVMALFPGIFSTFVLTIPPFVSISVDVAGDRCWWGKTVGCRVAMPPDAAKRPGRGRFVVAA